MIDVLTLIQIWKPAQCCPPHKLLLPDFSPCYFWRSCGVGDSEHTLICKQRQMSVLRALASTIINQQSSHFRTWRMSHMDVLPCWEEDTNMDQWKWIHTELCQVFHMAARVYILLYLPWCTFHPAFWNSRWHGMGLTLISEHSSPSCTRKLLL